jgi:hypothetical protein
LTILRSVPASDATPCLRRVSVTPSREWQTTQSVSTAKYWQIDKQQLCVRVSVVKIA